MTITRDQLWRAPLLNLVRLAKALGVRGCACGDVDCRERIVEAVARRCA